MSVLWISLATVFVLFVLAFVFYGLARPFGPHDERFRDSRTGDRRWESPHLESRDEYEDTHDTGSPHLESRAEYERSHHVPA